MQPDRVDRHDDRVGARSDGSATNSPHPVGHDRLRHPGAHVDRPARRTWATGHELVRQRHLLPGDVGPADPVHRQRRVDAVGRCGTRRRVAARLWSAAVSGGQHGVTAGWTLPRHRTRRPARREQAGGRQAPPAVDSPPCSPRVPTSWMVRAKSADVPARRAGSVAAREQHRRLRTRVRPTGRRLALLRRQLRRGARRARRARRRQRRGQEHHPAHPVRRAARPTRASSRSAARCSRMTQDVGMSRPTDTLREMLDRGGAAGAARRRPGAGRRREGDARRHRRRHGVRRGHHPLGRHGRLRARVAVGGRRPAQREDAGRPTSPPAWSASCRGGERKRLVLDLLLNSGADVLLLDEPDNYLDIPTRVWLEEQIKACKSTILMVSHDRTLLERVATKIIVIEGSGCWVHGGSYATFPEARAEAAGAARRRAEALERRGASPVPAHEDHEAARRAELQERHQGQRGRDPVGEVRRRRPAAAAGARPADLRVASAAPTRPAGS